MSTTEAEPRKERKKERKKNISTIMGPDRLSESVNIVTQSQKEIKKWSYENKNYDTSRLWTVESSDSEIAIKC